MKHLTELRKPWHGDLKCAYTTYTKYFLHRQLHAAYDENLRYYMRQIPRIENLYIRNKFGTKNRTKQQW